jgi:hypothetical protein
MTTAPKSRHAPAGELTVHTERRTQLLDVTAGVAKMVADSGVQSGVCYVYVYWTREPSRFTPTARLSRIRGATRGVLQSRGTPNT